MRKKPTTLLDRYARTPASYPTKAALDAASRRLRITMSLESATNRYRLQP